MRVVFDDPITGVLFCAYIYLVALNPTLGEQRQRVCLRLHPSKSVAARGAL